MSQPPRARSPAVPPSRSPRPAVRQARNSTCRPEEQKKLAPSRRPAAADAGVVGADPDAAAPGKLEVEVGAQEREAEAEEAAPRRRRRRRCWRRRPFTARGGGGGGGGGAPSAAAAAAPAAGASAPPPPDAGSEVEKKLKRLRKRLRQIEELGGEGEGRHGAQRRPEGKGGGARRGRGRHCQVGEDGERRGRPRQEGPAQEAAADRGAEERLGEGLSLNDEQTGKIESKPKVELEGADDRGARRRASAGPRRRARRGGGAGRQERERTRLRRRTPPLDAGRLPQPRGAAAEYADTDRARRARNTGVVRHVGRAPNASALDARGLLVYLPLPFLPPPGRRRRRRLLLLVERRTHLPQYCRSKCDAMQTRRRRVILPLPSTL